MNSGQPPSRAESAEGAGNARTRWFEFLSKIPADALAASGLLSDELHRGSSSVLSDAYLKARAQQAKEYSELVGFWVTWHLAGGFDQLELWGWSRATIYRKMKIFRERFGGHPDEYVFDWISLDLPTAWTNNFLSALGVEDQP